jgi:hypothetical protein
VAGFCNYCDEPVGSGATELVLLFKLLLSYLLLQILVVSVEVENLEERAWA